MSELAVADRSVVTIHYTLRDADGEVIDSSEGGDPLSYLHGAGNIVPGLERELESKAVGDKVDASVAPVDGYGERTGPEPQRVPRTEFPDDAPLAVGMQILAELEDGDPIPLWIMEVTDEEVVVDHNHPLAGVTLNFSVEVVDIRAATDDEIAHGHPHGPGGHHH